MLDRIYPIDNVIYPGYISRTVVIYQGGVTDIGKGEEPDTIGHGPAIKLIEVAVQY